MLRGFVKNCLPLFLFPAILPAGVKVEQTEEGVLVSTDGQPILQFQVKKIQPPEGIDALYAGSGFIHPLRSPSGIVLTDPFPVGHSHQHAVFSAWTRTTFHGKRVDFWNKHRMTGYSEAVSVDKVGKNGFTVTRRMVSREHGPAIIETWDVQVEAGKDVFIVDIALRQRTAKREPVHVREWHYGGFAFRGSAAWNSEGDPAFEAPMRILTGKGTTNLEEANNERPRWVAAYGSVKGEVAGVVMMDHPSNFRHPQPVRIHPVMPYFVFSPPILGSFEIGPKAPYSGRYRIITYDGKPDAEKLEEWYQAYARLP
ncbi:MAG: PmoA family protein [Puniceicoccaceae bacterium]